MANEPATQPATPADRMEQFHTYMRNRAQVEAPDAKALAADISARNQEAIFAAAESGTDEDVWNAGTGGAIQGRSCVNEEGGLEIRIYGFRSVISTRTFEGEDAETRKGYYINIDATVLGGPQSLLRQLGLSIGDEFALQTGADDIISRLRAFELRGKFENGGYLDARISGVKTSGDNVVIKLRPLPVRAVQGKTEK